jgi:CheY-like chemotaxis protein
MNDISNGSQVVRLSDQVRVLLADDEAAFRCCVNIYLSRAGYVVTEVADGKQALEALQAGPYDLLITDQQMPNLTGAELISRLRLAGMNLPVIVAASDLEPFNASEFSRLKIAALLQKPFGLDELRRALDQSLSPLLACPQLEPKDMQLSGCH